MKPELPDIDDQKSDFGPVAERQVLAENGAKLHVGFQVTDPGHFMATTGWIAEVVLQPDSCQTDVTKRESSSSDGNVNIHRSIQHDGSTDIYLIL